MRNIALCFLLATLLVVTGCGSSGPKPIAVVVTPTGAQALDIGQSFNITVSVSNDTLSKGVTWTSSGVGTLSGQSATGATYTAPATGTGGTATVTVTSVTDPTKTQTLNIVVTAPPSITTTSLAVAVVGTAYNQSIAETGGAGALTYSLTLGSLPAGLNLSSSTGAITGTPTGPAGTVNFTVQVRDASTVSPQTSSKALSITVNQAPAITSANSAAFTAGVPGTFTVTATGSPTPSLTETGALPAGVTFLDNGNATATLSGTAAATGTFPFTITASNGVGSNATQNFTLTIGQSAAITSGNNATFTVGAAGTFTVTTTGFPAPALTETGALPTGVTLVDNHNGTATLAGTPAAGTGGTYSFSIKAHNGIGTDATQSFTLTVDQAPAITSANSTTLTVGTAGTFTVTTTGFPAPALTETGALPTGVTFTDNGNGTATLAGTPTGTAGTFSLALKASNGVGSNATQTFTLTVGQSAAISSANSTTFTVGAAGTFTVTTTGFPAPVLTETGALPSGVTFTDNGNGTATLAGTPGTGTGGTHSLSFKAHNGIGTDTTQSFTLTVNQAPAITSATSVTFSEGAAGTFTVTTTGFPAPALTETGALPTGVTFVDNNNGTATLAGTSAAGTAGSYPLTLHATNSVNTATQTFTLTVNTAAAITSANSTTFTVGAAGTFTVTTTGTPTPSITQTGALPSGVTFTDNGNGTATLAGTPAAGTGGTYSLSIKAHNGIGADATQTFTLTVDQAAAITSANNFTFTVGAAGTFSVTATGFPEPALSETGALPTGVTFVDNNNGTATLAGTPAAGTGGSYPLTLHATNSVNTATQSFTLTVIIPPLLISPTGGSLPSGIVNTSYSDTVSANGGVPPYTFTLNGGSGPLPTGLTLSTSGQITGTPTVSGTYPFTVLVTDSATPTANTATANLSINVSSATLSCSDAPTGHESMLSGQYAFLLQGFKGTGNGNPVAIVASFHADGTGHVTSGDFDVNDGTAVHATINAGTYRVGLDSTSSGNLGCMLLPLSVGGTAEFRFSLGGLSAGILYRGRIIEYDDATGTGSRGSGVLLRQDPTQFGLSHLHSRYAFGNDGVDSNGGHFASGGSFTVDTSGNMSSGYNDVDDDGTLTTGVTGGTGLIGAVSTTTGRAIMSTSFGGNTSTLADYMVNANEIFFIGTDPLSSSPIYTGRAIVTASSFSQSSLSGNYVIHMTRIGTGCNGGNPCAGVTLGLVNMNAGSGAFTGTIYDYDIINGGSTQTFTSGAGATYTVNATSGRTTINGAGSGAPVLYIATPTATTEPISTFNISTDSSASFGFAEFQPAATYSTAGMAGNYFVGTEDPGDNTVDDETDVVALSSSGAVTGTGYDSGQSGLSATSATGSTVSIGANGVGNTDSNKNVAITNGTRLFFIRQGAAGHTAKITVVEKQ